MKDGTRSGTLQNPCHHSRRGRPWLKAVSAPDFVQEGLDAIFLGACDQPRLARAAPASVCAVGV